MAIKKKFLQIKTALESAAVGSKQFELENNLALNATNTSGGSEALLKLDSSNVLQLLKLPRVSSDPSVGDDLARKSWIESQIEDAKSLLMLDIQAAQQAIYTETQRAIGEEQRIEGLIEAEEQRALQAEAALGLRIDAEYQRAVTREDEIYDLAQTKIPLAYIGAANGVTPLGADSKIPSQYLPAVAITEVFVRTTIAERDALVVSGQVQTGDVVKVTEAVTSASGVKLSRSYIYDGSAFVELSTESDVDSVAGRVGHITLDTRDVSEFGDYRYYTATREQAVKDYADMAVAAEAGLRTQEDALIRQEFAAADAIVLQDAKDYADMIVSDEAALRSAEDLTFLKLDGSRPMTSDLSMGGHKISSLASPSLSSDAATKGYVDMQVTTGITDMLGQPNGIATLDGGGKVPVSQLPNAIMSYKGMWDASTNTPSLSNSGNSPESLGDVYRVSVAGSVDFGAGSISFQVGDYAILGAMGWEKSDGTDQVTSVNGFQGIVTLDTSHISEQGDYRYYTAAREAAVKAYTDSELDKLEVQSMEYESFTLSAQDITNGYIDVSATMVRPPLVFRQHLKGRVSVDFTWSGSRITFSGEWAAGSSQSPIEAGDLVEVIYLKIVKPYQS